MSGPLHNYNLMIKAGELKPDSHQHIIVEKLQFLHDSLVGYEAKLFHNNNFFRRLLRKKTAQNFPKGLYIHGDVGRGKSMIMDLFYETAPITKKRRVHFHAFMLAIHQAMHEWRYMDKASRMALHGTVQDDPILPLAKKIAKESLLLCFDEFQVSDVTDAMILGRLFSSLMALGVVMVLTSNRPPDDLYRDGLNRSLFLPSITLIKDKLDVVTLNGPIDYRLERMKGMDVYYHPLGNLATEALSKAFWRLTDHEVADRTKVGPQELQVQGRKIFVPVADKGVAVFSFKKLCGAALGAADYLEIAWHYHTVIMVGIPRLGPENRNEAKRFVTFIDILYENNVKFLCCAEVAPEKLYEEGQGHFEFQRTVSRLIEMQSQEYLAKGHAI
ncbi:MAG: AFG1 family ATPase [Emcibacter sp.]|nr:AFG1 family ATPase [Emcibacter sp.]